MRRRGEPTSARLLDNDLCGSCVDELTCAPFIDGNGRTGRLELNLILVRLGLPPAIIFKSNRNRYLTALDKADKADPGPLAELPARLVLLKSLATPELSYEALRQAAARGRLEVSHSSDGTVRSSKLAVDTCRDSKYSRQREAE